ncbi:3,4-dihydroxy-2-butanone-4-phosphate synthase [Metaplanococcus flavidus]|uniref:3,4-dihydroxy-2-butanone 4-phosphate synthase n=1 Tax=Metaplanococcus flavidus TaxID=569883 RepID=A0ABW3L6G6_9BACL
MFYTVEEALKDLKEGKAIIVIDDEDRENEGDFIALGEHATPEIINFMATEGRGLICVPVTEELAKKIGVGLMTDNNTDDYGTAFTISIDHKDSTTGISAFERSHTILSMVQEGAKPSDFKRPGHIFPLIAKDGGVLERTGHTEAAVDLAKLAGSAPAGVICEIMNADGTMARVPDLITVAERLKLGILTIKDLVSYQQKIQEAVSNHSQKGE